MFASAASPRYITGAGTRTAATVPGDGQGEAAGKGLEAAALLRGRQRTGCPPQHSALFTCRTSGIRAGDLLKSEARARIFLHSHCLSPRIPTKMLNITPLALQMRKLRQRLNDLSEIPSKSVARRQTAGSPLSSSALLKRKPRSSSPTHSLCARSRNTQHREFCSWQFTTHGC